MNTAVSSGSEQSVQRRIRWEAFDAGLLALWLVAGTIALATKPWELFRHFDGGYMRELARRQFEWGVPGFTTSIDFFQGVGDLFFSGLSFTLLPSYVIASFFGPTDTAKVIVYSVTLAEFTVAAVIRPQLG